mmetsp:Transcript_30648/g.117224  ORF Transcript_30648/g.117224 Transcript_30648/m.117224 type:complete len:128 (+) Transcript_30648:917-1300(+)
MDHCVKRCVDKLEELLEAGLLCEMFPDAKAEVAKELCRQRKFNGDILPHFAEKHTSVLALPDCSYLTEEDLLSAFGQCQGPGLDQVNLGFCGRGMIPKYSFPSMHCRLWDLVERRCGTYVLRGFRFL